MFFFYRAGEFWYIISVMQAELSDGLYGQSLRYDFNLKCTRNVFIYNSALKKKKKERYSIRHLKYILTAISALYIFNTLAYRLQKCCIFSQLTEIRNVTCKSCIHDLLFFFVGCYWGYFVQVFYKWWLDSFKQESVVMV